MCTSVGKNYILSPFRDQLIRDQLINELVEWNGIKLSHVVRNWEFLMESILWRVILSSK